MQNKSLITGVALSAIAIVGIVTAVNVSNMQKASSTAAVVKSQSQVASDLIINSITQEQLQKIDADRATLLTTLKPLNYTFKTNITATSPSSEIKKMQEVLRDNMYYGGDLTGKMDNMTTTALMELQSENELPQSSTAGPKTREVLTRLAGSVGPCQGTLQSVRLKKPNGGEIYQDGQQVLVSWRSCNIPSTNGISISLELYNTNNTPLGTISSSSFSTLNSGSKMITLPAINFISQANQAFSGVSFGQHFKVLISTIGLSAYDDSDSFFSINRSQVACTPTSPQRSL
jgi:type II secretory pathway pseudopilin PulG